MPIDSNNDNIERPDPPVEPATEGISNLVIAEGAPVSRNVPRMPIDSNNDNIERPDPPVEPATEGISNLVIAEGAPFHLKLKNLKCSEVRWFFKSRMGKLVAFNGNDSLILEIMYRFANGQSLDTDAQLIHDKYLNEFYFRKKESSGTPNDAQQPKPPPLILNHLYKASDDLKTISPAFWKGEPISIERGAYLTLTDEIIEQKLAMVLQELQDEVLVGTYPHEENIEIETESGSIEKVHVVWYSPTYLVTHREDGKTRTLIKHYKAAATWSVEHSKVDHLVFTVHGVSNNGKVHNIVDGAKGLNKGVNSLTEKGCGIVFMPIHWRTDLFEDETSHKCAKITGRMSARLQNLLDDVKRYYCKECGPKIKEKVIEEFESLYKEFLYYHPHPKFNGCVSLFGHSLGSVICYDILTEKPKLDSKTDTKKEPKVDKLFTVGSPLWFFFEHRGKADMTKFRRTVESLPIYNIYHPNDPVAGRLEEVVDSYYKDTPPIEIPKKSKKLTWRYRFIARPATRVMSSNVRRSKVLLRKIIMLRGVTKLKFPIDYELKMAGEWNYLHSHTIYWRHDSVFRLLAFIFTQENRSQVEIKNPENEESQEENQVKIGLENLEISGNLGNNEGDQPTTSDPKKGIIDKTGNQAETQKETSETSGNSENSEIPTFQESSETNNDAATQTEISYPIRSNRTKSA
ncbi:hypothetical protein L3Y34_000344 [Caenorhabditis briggsae]|uniref:DDHD domain-containing protein n=1 Tax=Caenorhabditis briggsae TaxID=6238 RepID=A0AAE9D997_CAEBR|nr:hypothetical protein L3Y34_000344 [Caenorhabditis briggsae]